MRTATSFYVCIAEDEPWTLEFVEALALRPRACSRDHRYRLTVCAYRDAVSAVHDASSTEVQLVRASQLLMATLTTVENGQSQN